jgi:hypothetical protein
MITRQCQFCRKDFQVPNKGSNRKNCDEHIGYFKKNYKYVSGAMHRRCTKCNTFKSEDQFYSKQNARGSSWCKECFSKGTYQYQIDRAEERKMHFIKQKGGCCERCGYMKNTAALCFHHLEEKEFNLDARHLANNSMAVLEKEMEKCQLLCHNCHMEVHYPHLDDKL